MPISDPSLEAPPGLGLTSNHFSEVQHITSTGAAAREQGHRHEVFFMAILLSWSRPKEMFLRAPQAPGALPFGVVTQSHQHWDALELPDVGLHLVVAVAEVCRCALALDLASGGSPALGNHLGQLWLSPVGGGARPCAGCPSCARLPRSCWARGAQ